MCKIMEEMVEEAKEEGKIMNSYETAFKMLKKRKLTLEDIAEYSGLPLEDVQELAEENNLIPV